MKIMTVITCLSLLVGYHKLANAQTINWDYPIKPGSVEWSKLANVYERINVCQIPDSVLHKLTTEQLLIICYKHPFFRGYIASNSLIDGFRGGMGSFNGYNELMARSDAFEIMLMNFKNENFSKINDLRTPIQKGEYTLRFDGLELMMSNDSLISKLTVDQKKVSS